MLRHQDSSDYPWLSEMVEGSMKRASGNAGSVLCPDLIGSYMDVFNMLE